MEFLDNIEMDLKGIVYEDDKWIYVVQDRVLVLGFCGDRDDHFGFHSEEMLLTVEYAASSLGSRCVHS
jgi:hypothetical protein